MQIYANSSVVFCQYDAYRNGRGDSSMTVILRQ